MEKKIRVMTFNIKNSRDYSNPKNIWINRKISVLKIIQIYKPNIIGFQEVYEDQLDFLNDNLHEYKYEGVGRDDGIRAGEFSPIFYRELEVKNTGTFWLSDTPGICSKTWGGLFRICTWINFKNSIPFAVYNTHFEDTESSIRLKSIPLVISKINNHSPNQPVILSGDLNFGRNSEEYLKLGQHFRDTYCIQNNKFRWAITSHGFKGKKRSLLSWNGRHIIDYIWVKGPIKVQDTRIIHDNPGKDPSIFPSDHWPVISDLTLYYP